MHDLLEVLQRSIGGRDAFAQSALSCIMARCDSITRELKEKDDLTQANLSFVTHERDALKLELQQAREHNEDVEELKRTAEKSRQRAATWDKQVAALEEQCRVAGEKVSQLQLENSELSRGSSESHKRAKQLRSYCQQLEASNTSLDERLQTWEERALKAEKAKGQAEEKCRDLEQELERRSFSSDLANVLKRRSAANLMSPSVRTGIATD